MIFSGKRPTNLGVVDGKLASCPSTPNCVSSQADKNSRVYIEPLCLTRNPREMIEYLCKRVESLSGARVITIDDRYMHVECKSSLLGFVDDLEFYVDAEHQLVHVRSASRLGYSDFGVNRKRVEMIRVMLN